MFGLRMLTAFALTVLAVSAGAYVILGREVATRQLADFATAQRADAAAIEEASVSPRGLRLGALQRVLTVLARSDGVIDVRVVGPGHVVIAASDPGAGGHLDTSPAIDATLVHHTAYSGPETSPTAQTRHAVEFVTPVRLTAGPAAYEATYASATVYASVDAIRRTIVLLGLLALVGGTFIFYVAGGRRLLRDHRVALSRAFRDGLTDLPNLRAFQSELDTAVTAAQQLGEPVALAILDVDDFKYLNDRYGHAHGDEILKRTSGELAKTSADESSYRIGGDEFALLFRRAGADTADSAARHRLRALAALGVDASIGMSSLQPGMTPEALREEADQALYEAKRKGGSHVVHAHDVKDHLHVTTAEKKESVRRLIANSAFGTEYQPIWNIETGALVAVEALTRPDPRYGFAGPGELFDIAEQTNRVRELDVLCVEQALQALPSLPADTLVFINLSPLTLDVDADNPAWLTPAVERAGLSPSRVVVEVTERLGGRVEAVIRRVGQLREQGFRIAVDDVGTGNSGLDMLRRINAEFVKIDGGIVAAAANDPAARGVVLAVASFARETGAFVICEGIGDDDTLDEVRALNGVRRTATLPAILGGQGFLLGRPSPDAPTQPDPFAGLSPAARMRDRPRGAAAAVQPS